MISRRKFLQTTAFSALLAPVALNSIASCKREQKLTKFGYISGIIGKELEADWKSALRRTVDMGYTEFEGEVDGVSPADFISFCREIGLIPVAGGVGFNAPDDDTLRRLDILKEQNMEYAVSYWPWLTGGPFSADDCKRSADILNHLGELCKQKEIKLCWHNHDKEFIANEQGGLPFDFLMNHTDPSLVKCEMDIYWVKKGGGDPLQVLKKYPGRISILHVKDMAAGEAMDFECPGSGIIDFAVIFDEAVNQGIEHFMVERDNVQDGMACLKSAAAYLKEIVL
jgi:sugar phosphate isomerase/epimerase